MDSIAYIRQIQHRYKTQPLSYSRSLLWLLLHLVSVKHLLNSDLNNTNISSASLHVAFLTIEFCPPSTLPPPPPPPSQSQTSVYSYLQ